MESVQVFLAHIWFFLAGMMLMLYVMLDGFDLGVGILSLVAPNEERRSIMMTSLGSVWDANETWLVLTAGTLFGAFAVVYSVVLHALYIPLTIMLFGLIFRGVAFEFREHAIRKRFWNYAFGIGSLVAAAAQGFVLGGILSGIEVHQGRFVGGVFDWANWFSLLVAIGVVTGYALLGATYLIMKTTAHLQEDSYRHARLASWAMLVAAMGVTLYTPLLYTHVADTWFEIPRFFFIGTLPTTALFAFFMLHRALRRKYEHAPFLWTLLIFSASFAGLAISLYPYLIPGRVTLMEAAASEKTLIFMLVGVGFLIPIMLVYNGYLYLVFRGKVHGPNYHE